MCFGLEIKYYRAKSIKTPILGSLGNLDKQTADERIVLSAFGRLIVCSEKILCCALVNTWNELTFRTSTCE